MSAMIQSLQDNFSRQPVAPGGDYVHQIRAQAMQEFLNAGLPGPRDEYWKYTRLRILEKRNFVLPQKNAVAGSDFGIKNLDAIRIVFVDGIYSPALSDESAFAENGIRLLADALRDDSGLAVGLLPQPDPAVHQFAALNRAFQEQGVVLELEPGRELPRPLYLLFHSQNTGQDTASHPRILIRSGAGSKASVIEHYNGEEDTAGFCNALTEIDLASGAQLTHYRVQTESDTAFHVGSLFARQAEDSRLVSHNLGLGGRLARTNMQFELMGRGAELVLNGLYLASGKQHIDNHTLVNHREPGANSFQDYRGILNDKARAVFCGKAVVHRDAQQTVATQSNRNLLLSHGAEIDTQPVLEIYADDVQCSHGATIGQLDTDALFYLTTRGIPEDEARSLLTFAFAEDVVLRLENQTLRNAITEHLIGRLPEMKDTDELVTV
jgi:Fe-S cluster assembly protein SufD